MAEIKWFGHACFRLRSREATIITDPVPRTLGYKVDKQRADIVTLSHDHPGHTATEIISGEFKVVQAPGEYEMNEVFITGIRTYHDNKRGAERGRNTIYIIEIENITICHLGDLGHTLSVEQVEALTAVDILIVPIGGGPVLDADKAAEVVGQIEPKIVIPMQYRNPLGDHDRADLERFLKEMAVHDVAPLDKLTVKPSDLREMTEVVVLEVGASAR
ncbi:MAG: MBL fold metallo-hydrolase [Chloroflexia bacterium]|jgi:L-ascorbate metabolism protein UlaG (beta-lactamase superfamily)|nr:MBL fold metallo-hydrolase [Chloroflexia bacterium]